LALFSYLYITDPLKKSNLYWFAAVLVLGIYGFSSRSRAETPTIHWMNFGQLADSMKVRPKRVFVKIYTQWCGPCKMMDRKTLSKARIIEPLNDYYYSIELDAESKEEIRFKDSVFTFDPGLGASGVHNLAVHLGKDAGHLSFPTVVILDENLEVIYRYPSFMSVANLEEVLYLYKDLK
jgi:thioredoxin-related protein